MPRPIWKGSISFGLVNIPVALHAAEKRNELSFKMLDKRNSAPVRYKRVNVKSGREVPWEDIIKGYEHREGQYVTLGEADFRRANVEASQTVEITSFVNASEIEPIYYDKPYYLEPLKKARKSYALLREVLARTGKTGIGKIVIRSRQPLAALIVRGPVIVVDLLRYAHELRDPKELDLPEENLKKLEIEEKELKLAERLLEAMTEPWKLEKYTDTYREDLLELIEKKVKAGKTKAAEEPAEEVPAKRRAQVVDIMDLLKRSVEKVQKEEAPPRRRSEMRRKAG